jgi:hypothetical protein
LTKNKKAIIVNAHAFLKKPQTHQKLTIYGKLEELLGISKSTIKGLLLSLTKP